MCELCEHKELSCTKQHEVSHMVCTRSTGHTGKHAACGIMPDEHPIFEWDDEVKGGQEDG